MDKFQILLMIGISAILWLIYKTVLSHQKTLIFNRYFLLAILVLSTLIPFIHFEVLSGNPIAVMPEYQSSGLTLDANPTGSPTDWRKIFLSAYVLVSGLLALRFLISLAIIFKTILENNRLQKEGFTYVFLRQPHVPYCFLKYIFVSGEEFTENSIEKEILIHEETHARQLHTLDVILVEIILIFAWFNPFYWLIKRSVVANHEFIADENAINHAKNASSYKKLIIEKIILPYHNQFASNFNFMLTKRRFLMMTKKISQRKARLIKLTGIVLLCGGIGAGVLANAQPSRKNHENTTVYSNAPERIVKSISSIPVRSAKPAIPQFLPLKIRQDTLTKPAKDQDIAAYLDHPADYKGGINLFRNRFQAAFDASNVKAKGEVAATVSFVINTDGSISDLTAAGADTSFNAEALRAVKAASSDYNWIPGILDQKPVRSRFKFPIKMVFDGTTTSKTANTAKIAAIDAKAAEEAKKDGVVFSQHLHKAATFKTGINDFRTRFQQAFDANKVKGSGDLSTMITFVIRENGSITDVQAAGVNKSFNLEAVRAVKIASSGKDWNPDELNGKPVRSLFKFPIRMNFSF